MFGKLLHGMTEIKNLLRLDGDPVEAADDHRGPVTSGRAYG
jgi:hypothetical protein